MNNELSRETYYGLLDVWQHWYDNAIQNGYHPDAAIKFASSQVESIVQKACVKFADVMTDIVR